LQTSSNPTPNSEYISQSDEEEARRFMELNGDRGLEVLTADDIRQYALDDYGLGNDLSR
jgi:hypothetical protein